MTAGVVRLLSAEASVAGPVGESVGDGTFAAGGADLYILLASTCEVGEGREIGDGPLAACPPGDGSRRAAPSCEGTAWAALGLQPLPRFVSGLSIDIAIAVLTAAIYGHNPFCPSLSLSYGALYYDLYNEPRKNGRYA